MTPITTTFSPGTYMSTIDFTNRLTLVLKPNPVSQIYIFSNGSYTANFSDVGLTITTIESIDNFLITPVAVVTAALNTPRPTNGLWQKHRIPANASELMKVELVRQIPEYWENKILAYLKNSSERNDREDNKFQGDILQIRDIIKRRIGCDDNHLRYLTLEAAHLTTSKSILEALERSIIE